MKKRSIAGVLALFLSAVVLSGCQLIGKLTGSGGQSKVQALPLPSETPTFQLFAATEEDHLKTVAVPENYTAYDHKLTATTTANPRDGYRVAYSLHFWFFTYRKAYETSCEIELIPWESDSINGFSLDLFKQEGAFLWKALAKTHHLSESALDAGLKKLSDRVAANEKADGILGYSYTSDDMPGIELVYKPTGESDGKRLQVYLYNEIPEAVEEQGKGFTQLADSVLSALAEQKVPIKYTTSKFFYIKADQSDEAVIITDLSHNYADYETYTDFSRSSKFEFTGDVDRGEKRYPRAAHDEILQEGFLYSGVGEPISREPVDPDAFCEEAKALINQWEMSDQTRRQLLGFIDKGTIQAGTEDFLSLSEEDSAPNQNASYELSSGAYSVSIRRLIAEKAGTTGGSDLPTLPDNLSDLLPDDITQDTVR